MFKEYLNLNNYIKIRWFLFVLGMIFMVLSILSSGVSLSMIVPLMDRIFSHQKILFPENLPPFLKNFLEPIKSFLNNTQPILLLKYLIFFIISVIFIKNLFSYLQSLLLRIFGERILADLREKIYSKITVLSLDFFSKKRTGELTTRIIYDVGVLRKAITDGFPKFFFKLFESIVYLSIVIMIDWKMALLSFLIFPVLLYPIFRITKKLRKLRTAVQKGYGNLGNTINETIYGQQIIKAFNQEENILRRFKRENESIFRTIVSISKRTVAIAPFTEIVATVGASGIIYYGARKVIVGEMTPGFFTLFLTGLFSLISPLKTIGSSYAEIKQASSALPRIFSILEEEIKVKDKGKKVFQSFKDRIEFINVSFSYGKRGILKNLSFTVRKGEKVGIVGPTGVGKTTLIGLLLRFYEPTEGEICIDGENIKNFTLRSLRNNIGLVTQEPILFYDTINRNISLGENEDRERIKRAAEISGISSFIESLPEKYETIIGERGFNLSGGQKQLITVARAIYKNPPILILDEATSSLDSNSERMLQLALEKAMEGRTVFIIAHRLSTLRNVDKILVLKEGYIVEEGTHNQLIEKKGVYYNLWKLQYHSA